MYFPFKQKLKKWIKSKIKNLFQEESLKTKDDILNLIYSQNIFSERLKELFEKAIEYEKQLDSLSQRLDKQSYQNFSNNLLSDAKWREDLSCALLNQAQIWGTWDKVHLGRGTNLCNTLLNTDSGDIFIGDYSFTGQNVAILTGSHDSQKSGKERQLAIASGNDIHIGKGVWLGSGCVVLGPCEIGDNAVVAAGAVVLPNTKIEPSSLYAGVPAKFKKSLSVRDDLYGKVYSPTTIADVSSILMIFMHVSKNAKKTTDKVILLENGIMYGPYLNLSRGTYILTFFVSNLSEDNSLRITRDSGRNEIFSRKIVPGENRVSFDIVDDLTYDVEFVINSEKGMDISDIKIVGTL